ncbi:DUF2075 domain-containing protein [Latilactobacillus sakei]
MKKSLTLKEFLSIYGKNILKKSLEYHELDIKERECQNFATFGRLIIDTYHEDFTGFFLDSEIGILPDFDLIRYTKNSIFYMDFKDKADNSTLDKVKNKFIKRLPVLHSFNKENVFICLFEVEDLKFYVFDETGNKMVDSTLEDIYNFLKNYNSDILNNDLISDMKPKQYLIDPVREFDKFINNQYVLSSCQNSIVNSIANGNHGLYGVYGSGGTGKTLLALHLVKQDRFKKVAFFFTGNLREGHRELEEALDNVKFFRIKDLFVPSLDEYDLIVVDEAQRLKSSQIKTLDRQKNNSKVVFFYDSVHQILSSQENGQLLNSLIDNHNLFKLEKNVRSNAYISAFVEEVFNLRKKPNKKIDIYRLRDTIDLKYFENKQDAVTWIKECQSKGYSLLLPTGDNRNIASVDGFSGLSGAENPNTHAIIGSELDKVVTYVDECIKYDANGIIIKNSSEYYYIDNEFYINLSRAREKLALAIINNPDMYEAILNVVFELDNRNIHELPITLESSSDGEYTLRITQKDLNDMQADVTTKFTKEISKDGRTLTFKKSI